MNNDIWKNAPEDATHHVEDVEDGRLTEFVEHRMNGKHGEAYYSLSDLGSHWSIYVENDRLFKLTPRPETKPVYTQAMCDNGELPSVGMEVMHHSVKKTVVGNHDVNYNFPLLSINNVYVLVGLRDIKPLTPPKTDKEKAIDDTYRSDLDVKGNLSMAYDKWVTGSKS